MDEIHVKSQGEKVIEEISKEKPQEIKVLEIDEIRKPSQGQALLNKIREGELFKDKAKVISGEAIQKETSKEEVNIDKYGIPIPKNRRTWDKI